MTYLAFESFLQALICQPTTSLSRAQTLASLRSLGSVKYRNSLPRNLEALEGGHFSTSSASSPLHSITAPFRLSLIHSFFFDRDFHKEDFPFKPPLVSPNGVQLNIHILTSFATTSQQHLKGNGRVLHIGY